MCGRQMGDVLQKSVARQPRARDGTTVVDGEFKDIFCQINGSRFTIHGDSSPFAVLPTGCTWHIDAVEVGRSPLHHCRRDGPDGPRPELKRYALEFTNHHHHGWMHEE